MSKYDLIIVLASQPDPATWQFPSQIYQCLDTAHKLLDKGEAPMVALSGKWTIDFDYLPVEQPFRECDKMKEYLMGKGVAEDRILVEGDSKDTISNLYYLKKQIVRPRNIHKVLFMVAEFRIPRLKTLLKKIWGDSYDCEYLAIPAEPGQFYDEAHTIKIQMQFLEAMQDGDDSWLDGKFYSAWMYEYWGERALRKYYEGLLQANK